MNIPQSSEVTHANCAAVQQDVYRITDITWQWRSAPRFPSCLGTQMLFFCCSFESWDKQMLQHFKMLIFWKKENTHSYMPTVKPQTLKTYNQWALCAKFPLEIAYVIHSSYSKNIPCQIISYISHKYCACTDTPMVPDRADLSPPAFICPQQSQPLLHRNSCKSQIKGPSVPYPLCTSDHEALVHTGLRHSGCIKWPFRITSSQIQQRKEKDKDTCLSHCG